MLPETYGEAATTMLRQRSAMRRLENISETMLDP
jgi:hypothetical protein